MTQSVTIKHTQNIQEYNVNYLTLSINYWEGWITLWSNRWSQHTGGNGSHLIIGTSGKVLGQRREEVLSRPNVIGKDIERVCLITSCSSCDCYTRSSSRGSGSSCILCYWEEEGGEEEREREERRRWQWWWVGGGGGGGGGGRVLKRERRRGGRVSWEKEYWKVCLFATNTNKQNE